MYISLMQRRASQTIHHQFKNVINCYHWQGHYTVANIINLQHHYTGTHTPSLSSLALLQQWESLFYV